MPIVHIILAGAVEQPISTLLVEVLSTSFSSPLHVASPDDTGRVRIDLSDALLTSLFGEEYPRLYFRVWSGGQWLVETEEVLRWHTRDNERTLRLHLSGEARDGKPSPYVVRGRVHASALGPGWTIQALDQSLRGAPVSLGTARIAGDGAYSLSYCRSQLRPEGKLLADLHLVVFDAEGREQFRSQVFRRAAPTMPLDPVLDEAASRGPSAFERLARQVAPWLCGLCPTELEDAEVDGLARSTEINAAALHDWVTAHRLAEELARGEPPLRVPPKVAYALYVSGIRTTADVRSLREDDLRNGLVSARNRNVASVSEQDIDAIVSSALGAFGQGGRRGTLEPRTGANLSELLALGLDSCRTETFTRSWFTHKGDVESFWASLPDLEGFEDPTTVRRAKLVLELDTLTLGNMPLVETLLSDDVTEISELVRFDATAWERLLVKSGAEETRSTAQALAAAVEDSFPHSYVVARMREAPRPAEAPLVELLAKNPDIDLGTTSLRAWTTSNDVSAPTRKMLARATRVYRLTRGPDRLSSMRVLIERNLDSAPRITRLGKRAFLSQHAKALGGEDSAIKVWRRAASATMVAHTTLFRYRKDLNGLSPRAAGGGAPLALRKLSGSPQVSSEEGLPAQSQSSMPSWSELFGSSDSCVCEHCGSVLSASAYLTDLLHFLVDPPTGGDHSGWYDEFKKRRPDIPLIHLNCDNTDTMLPYLDLVNEVLEYAVVEGSAERQTTGRAEDLGLHPEYLDGDAYAELSKPALRHPWTLPFDLADNEVRAYLPLTATHRVALMNVFGTAHPIKDASDAERQERARESIGLPWAALNIVLNKAGAADWGLTDASSDWTEPSNASVRDWMRRSQLDYEAFDQVLRCRWVNADRDGFRVRVAFADGSCDLSNARLTVSDGVRDRPDTKKIDTWIQSVLSRIPRFVRLWRALGWTAYDLDKALFALGGSLDADDDGYSAVFTGIAELHRLFKELKLPVEELVTLWSSIPTDTPDQRPSLYDRRFQDPGRGPVSSAFALDPSRTELADTSPMLSTLRPSAEGVHVGVALGALRLKTEDLESLLNHLFPSDATTHLNLENLSRLYGAALLARAMKLKVADFLSLLELTGVDPFLDPFATREFVEEAAAARRAPLSLAKVAGLLTRRQAAVEDEQLGTVLRTLRTCIQETAAELAPIADSEGRRLSEILGQVLPESFESPHDSWTRDSLVSTLVGFVALDGLDADTLADWEVDGSSASDNTTTTVNAWQADFDTAWTALETVPELALVLARTDVGARLRNPGWLPDSAALASVEHGTGTTRHDFFQGALLQYRREHLAPARVAEALALSLGLEGDVTTELVETWIRAATEPADNLDPAILATDPAIALFVHGAFATADEPNWPEGSPDPLITAFPAQARTLQRLFAAAELFRALTPSVDELPLLLGNLRDPNWLDPDGLPVEEVTNPVALQASYAAWRRLRDAWAVRSLLGKASGPFPGFLRAAREAVANADPDWSANTLPGRLATLVDQLGWSEADLNHLVGANAFGASTAEIWADERWWQRLSSALALVQRTGLSARTLWSLARRPAEAAQRRVQADELKQAVRARYDESSWQLVARPVRDALRERQRDALAAWLLANRFPNFDTADDLYRWYLIDVQMSACGETSRIREALSAVQLFVQQGMLGLIDDVKFSTADREAWEWMSRYRVWEANRKVFLRPEHWMEPELRDDKSPFFEDLEKSILKDDITQENVERAYHEYLNKLDEVARLEVRGTVREVEPEGETDPNKMSVDRLHVVARTRAMPHCYFHRVRERGEGGVWGPWRPIDVEIEGDHVLPVVWDRRLYLFWPVFTAKEAAPEQMKVPAPGDDNHTPETSKKWLEVQLAWTRLHEGAWSPKGLSSQHARVNDRTLKDTDGFILMDYRVVGAEPYLVLRERWREDSDSEENLTAIQGGSYENTLASPPSGASRILAWFRVRAEGGVFDVQDLADIDDKLYQLQWPEYASVGNLPRTGRPDWSLAMSYLSRDELALPKDYDQWKDDTRVLESPPGPYSLTPLYPARRPERQATFPTLFFADERRSFVIDPVNSKSVPTKPPSPTLPESAGFTLERPLLSGTKRVPPRVVFGRHEQVFASEGYPGSSRFKKAKTGKISSFKRIWRFRTNQHPYVRLFVKHLNAYGLNGLLDPRPDSTALDDDERQFLRRQGTHKKKLGSWKFEGPKKNLGYEPTSLVIGTDAEGNNAYPRDEIDFSEGGTYSQYNWELFFHAPLLIALHLSRNQRFEEARSWFHYIFDPTDTAEEDEATPQRYWKVKPLYQTYWADDEHAQGIDRLLHLFSSDTTLEAKSAIYKDVADQIRGWLDRPFSPWAVARLRWSAYQRTVVLKYIDSLMDWGDSFFRQYTLESVDQARLLYVLASELLGPRPEDVEVQSRKPSSFKDLLDSGQLDVFSNALVEITAELDPTPSTAWDDLPPVLSPSLYFCIPRDEKLLAYWDRIADRLYKIRHCLDIDGVARRLALFDPPIDPGAMVRAVAGGAGIAGALASLNAPVPAFRYSVMSARAKELCSEVRAFGGALLAALEKRDAEALSRLRSSHELAILDAVAEVRQLQADEAKKGIEVLKGTRRLTEARLEHYQTLLEDGWSGLEVAQMTSMVVSGVLRVVAGGIETLAAALALVPQFEYGVAGFGGTPLLTSQYGGHQISKAATTTANIMNIAAGAADSVAATTGLAASHARRAQDWEFQRDLVQLEVSNIDTQIEAAELRYQIAQREQANHALQRDNAAEVQDFLRDKFTGVDLYDWMVGQLASVYVQAYQLALDLARRAERAWQFEVAAAQPPHFIHSSHWDSLRKGLLAGERLAMDLHRMEVAYLEQSRREYELTRHISLAEVDPLALLTLKATGTCEFTLPELLFDMDRPGLYHRRIKAVTLSLPCVTGPYAPVHATLRLLDSYVRTTPQIEDKSAESYGAPTPDDARFTWLPGPAQGVVTSGGQDDGGLFELNLRDERYLPFEGHGVVQSRWRIELPSEYRSFDYTTLSDMVLHLRFTAREGGVRLRDGANAAIAARVAAENEAAEGEELQRIFSLRTEEVVEWNALFQSVGAMSLNLRSERFPYVFRRSSTLKPIGGELWVFGGSNVSGTTAPSFVLSCSSNEDGSLELPDSAEVDLTELPNAPGMFRGSFSLDDAKPGTWSLALDSAPSGPWASDDDPQVLSSKAIRDAFLVLRYRV